MSDEAIPEDVMKAAVQFACCSADGCIRLDDECGEQMVCLEARQIARAILAERERCAQVAEDYPAQMIVMWDRPGGPPGNGTRATTFADIASSIRSSS